MRTGNNCLGLLVAGVLALGGCAAPPTTAPPAGAQFDGVYASQDVLVHGVDFQCGLAVLPETLAVRNGRFDYPFQVSPPRTAPLPVQVFADGTVYGAMQYASEDVGGLLPSHYVLDWVILQGHITGSTLDATVTDLRCARHLTAQRS